MRFLITLICISFLFLNCDPCNKFKNETYSEDTFQKFVDSSAIDQLGEYLFEWDEPEFKHVNYESYRLLIMSPVFKDTFFLIRIENRNDNYYLVTKKIVTLGSSKRPIFMGTGKRKLVSHEWDTLIKKVYNTKYWTLPQEIDRWNLGDTWWSIEGKRPQAAECEMRDQHFVLRWSPKESPFKELCDVFTKYID